MSVKMYLLLSKFCLLLSILVLSEANECGKIRSKEDDKIVNGRVIGYRKYPWFTALTLATNRRQLVCGGSLISSQLILTAAHCYKPYFTMVSNGETTFEDIYVAELNLENRCVADPKVQIFAITKVYIHEKYFSNLRYYDIAILELEVPTYDFIPVCLPTARYETNNRTNLEATIVGLGKEYANAFQLPCQVKEAEVIIQPDATCINMLNHANYNSSAFKNAFCAGTPEGDVDTCQGDSGGPLQVLTPDHNVMIMGITSFGFGCAQRNYYGVYTDVSHYLDWIHNIRKLYTNDEEDKNYVSTTTTPVTSVKPFSVSTARRMIQRRKNSSLLQFLKRWLQ